MTGRDRLFEAAKRQNQTISSDFGVLDRTLVFLAYKRDPNAIAKQNVVLKEKHYYRTKKKQ